MMMKYRVLCRSVVIRAQEITKSLTLSQLKKRYIEANAEIPVDYIHYISWATFCSVKNIVYQKYTEIEFTTEVSIWSLLGLT